MISPPIIANQPKNLSISFCVLLLYFVLASCSPQLVNHGNAVDPEDFAKILKGKTTKHDVRRLLGVPSTYSDFGVDTWFYMNSQTKTVAFFEKELIKRRIIFIKFSPEGTVESIEKLSERDQIEISLVDKETATSGHRVTLLQQLLGNVGRFNSQSKTD